MSASSGSVATAGPRPPGDPRARIAIDLGAGSCRVSLLRWHGASPEIQLVHRIPNGPVHADGSLRWPFDSIFAGLEEGLRKAALSAPEGVASIAVDGWAVDYVRLGADGQPLANPYCYRDERTVAAKERADQLAGPDWMYEHTGAQPLRINTIYQLLADSAAGVDPAVPWVNLPEYVLFRLGGRRVAEYTNATHTGLVDIETGGWSDGLLQTLNLSREALPPIVATGTVIGKLSGPLAELPAFQDTDLIVPACHDTASAIAGIRSSLKSTAYICSGTWSLVGTLIEKPITSAGARSAGFTNQGAAGGGYCFHTNVNGMWILEQCLETWRKDGRSWSVPDLIALASGCDDFPGIVPVDAPALLLDGPMPSLLNEQLRLAGYDTVPDIAGNEPMFARIIFESLASRYASVLRSLEELVGNSITRIHILGGGSLNRLLTKLTAERTGLAVETGNVESSTVGNFAVQMAVSEAAGNPLDRATVCTWARRLCEYRDCGEQPAVASGIAQPAVPN